MHTTCQLHQLSHLFELNVKCHVTYNLIGRVIWVDSFNVHEWLVLNYLALSVVDFDVQTPLKFGLKLSIIWERNIRPRGTWLGKVVMETMLVYCKDKSSYPSIVVERVKSRWSSFFQCIKHPYYIVPSVASYSCVGHSIMS